MSTTLTGRCPISLYGRKGSGKFASTCRPRIASVHRGKRHKAGGDRKIAGGRERQKENIRKERAKKEVCNLGVEPRTFGGPSGSSQSSYGSVPRGEVRRLPPGHTTGWGTDTSQLRSQRADHCANRTLDFVGRCTQNPDTYTAREGGPGSCRDCLHLGLGESTRRPRLTQ